MNIGDEADIWQTFAPLLNQLDSSSSVLVEEATSVLYALRENNSERDDILTAKEHLMLCFQASSSVSSQPAKLELLKQCAYAIRRLTFSREKVVLTLVDALAIPWRIFQGDTSKQEKSAIGEYYADVSQFFVQYLAATCVAKEKQFLESLHRLAWLESIRFLGTLIQHDDESVVKEVGSMIVSNLLNDFVSHDVTNQINLEMLLSVGEVPKTHSVAELLDDRSILELYLGDEDAEALDVDNSPSALMVSSCSVFLDRVSRLGSSCIAYLVLESGVERAKLSAMLHPARLMELAKLHAQRMLSNLDNTQNTPQSHEVMQQRAVSLLVRCLAPSRASRGTSSTWTSLPRSCFDPYCQAITPIVQLMANHPNSGIRTQMYRVICSILEQLPPHERIGVVVDKLYVIAPTPPSKGLLVDIVRKAVVQGHDPQEVSLITKVAKFAENELLECKELAQEMDMYTALLVLLETLYRNPLNKLEKNVPRLVTAVESICKGCEEYIAQKERKVKQVQDEHLLPEDVAQSWVNLRPGEPAVADSASPPERMPLNPEGIDKKIERELEIGNVFRAQLVDSSATRLLSVLQELLSRNNC